jgi:hypothetical protein
MLTAGCGCCFARQTGAMVQGKSRQHTTTLLCNSNMYHHCISISDISHQHAEWLRRRRSITDHSSGTKTCTSTGRPPGFDQTLRPNPPTAHRGPKPNIQGSNTHNPGAAFDDARIGTTGWDGDVVLSWGQENAMDG